MKITLQVIISLIILGFTVGFLIIKHIQKKSQKNQTELLIEGKPILKQFGNLLPKDFDDYPIWVQCHVIDYDQKWYKNTNEETFRPWTDKHSVSPEFAMFLIKAELKLSDGEIYRGFITPCLNSDHKSENDLGVIQPQIFTKTGKRFGFWTGVFPMEKSDIDEFYKIMNKKKDQIFPIDFKAIDTILNGVTSGRINGFLTIGENRNIIINK